jgi:hypothetical protein
MQDLFRVPWDDVTVEEVEAFLAEAGDEGLTWKRKEVTSRAGRRY